MKIQIFTSVSDDVQLQRLVSQHFIFVLSGNFSLLNLMIFRISSKVQTPSAEQPFTVVLVVITVKHIASHLPTLFLARVHDSTV